MHWRFGLSLGEPGVWDDGVQRQLERIVEAIGLPEILQRLEAICDARFADELLEHGDDDDYETVWDSCSLAITQAYDECYVAISLTEVA